MKHLQKSISYYDLIEDQREFLNDPLMMLKTTQVKKQDVRKFRPQGPIKPSKKKTIPKRTMNQKSNLTDLIDVDIFGEKMDSNFNPMFKSPKPQVSNNRGNNSFPQQQPMVHAKK